MYMYRYSHDLLLFLLEGQKQIPVPGRAGGQVGHVSSAGQPPQGGGGCSLVSHSSSRLAHGKGSSQGLCPSHECGVASSSILTP